MTGFLEPSQYLTASCPLSEIREAESWQSFFCHFTLCLPSACGLQAGLIRAFFFVNFRFYLLFISRAGIGRRHNRQFFALLTFCRFFSAARMRRIYGITCKYLLISFSAGLFCSALGQVRSIITYCLIPFSFSVGFSVLP